MSVKWLLSFVVLGGIALAQATNQYGPDYILLHCTTPDPNSNLAFGILPKPGLVPSISSNGNTILYCDSSNGGLKLSTNGGTFSSFSLSTGLPSYPEAYLSWQPGTLYPQILSGTCVFVASTTCTVNYPTTFSSIPVVNITPVNPGSVTFTLTTSSTSQIIITGSTSNSLTVNYTAVLPANINCTSNTFTLSGARQNADFVTPLWPSTLPANLIGTMRISTSDTIEVRLCNPTSSTVSFSAAISFGAKLFR